MTPTCTLIMYDISHPKRLREVYQICRGFGLHIQYSVFRADLTKSARAALIAALADVINHREDQVLLVALGPADGKAKGAFFSVGRAYEHPERYAHIY